MKTDRPELYRAVASGMRMLPALLLILGHAWAGEIHVMTSGGLAAVFDALAPGFERQTGDRIVTAYGPSMGATPQSIPNRLSRGEAADVVIVARSALDSLVREGKVLRGSEVDLVRSRIGMAVKAGTPLPDISSVEALKQTLLHARSIAYSDSASGVYVSNELFPLLGIADKVAGKARMIPATPVGLIVARGEAEVGFQQISELLPVAGIKLVGPIPEAVQKITVFSAGITASARNPADAKKLVAFLGSAQAWPEIRRGGLDPVPAHGAPVTHSPGR